MKIGIQGIAGSYSEMTVQDYINQQGIDKTATEIVCYSNFSDVTEGLIAGDVDLMVVPVENSTTGPITKLIDLLRYKPVMAIQQAYQVVNHSLWASEDTDVKAIDIVYSHPEALSQCENFFKDNPHIQAEPYADTARAARYVKTLNQKNCAAIASDRAGELYGLHAVRTNIQDASSNTTRFYVMERQQVLTTYSGDTAAIYVEAPHVAGSLLKILQVFDIFGGNLMNLWSRPLSNKPFSYGFFLEVRVDPLALTSLMETLDKVTQYVQLVGRFNSGGEQT